MDSGLVNRGKQTDDAGRSPIRELIPTIQPITEGLELPDKDLRSVRQIPRLFINRSEGAGEGRRVYGIAALLIITNVYMCKRRGIHSAHKRASAKEILRSTEKAFLVLLLPIIILGGIYGGFFTATEASAVGTVYALLLTIIYKELTVKKLIEAARKTVYTSAMVMFIIGVSGIFAWLLAAARVPATLAALITPLFANKYVYMLVLMLVLFVVGCLMDTIPAILILGPILVPIGTAMGWSSIHIGVCFCINPIVGFITPPFGINLFTVTSVAEVSFADAVKGVLPYLAAAVVGVMVVAFFPFFTEWLPSLAGMAIK